MTTHDTTTHTTRAGITTWAYEITDTFGSEANYCWVRRGTVRARSRRGAIRAMKRAESIGARHRVAYDQGDDVRIDFVCWTACAFLTATE